MRRIILSLTLISLVVGAITFGATNAFFNDSETSTANVFAAGAIDLTVDNESYYNGSLNKATSWEATDLTVERFFDFLDLKPNDYGEDTISLHVATNDAYLCAAVTLTSDDDNTQTEPEALVDPDGLTTGELDGLVHFLWWADDGDNVLEKDETVISSGNFAELGVGNSYPLTLADSDENIWTGQGGPVPGNEPLYIGKAWCFGEIAADPIDQDGGDQGRSPADDNDNNGTAGEPEDGGISCDGAALGNESQTDSLTADVSFEAVQARHNDDFQCAELDIVRECELSEEYAIAAHAVDQGTRKDGSAISADRTVVSYVFGPPQHPAGNDYDNPVVPNSFFSLGFKGSPAAAPGGSLIVEFPGEVVDGVGADLKLWEVTGGSNYPDEVVQIEVSDSLAGPWTLVEAGATRDAEIDIAPVASAKYVRITDVSSPGLFNNAADGFDLDAVQALNCIISDY